MHLKLWKQVALSLLLPGAFALAISLYAIYNIGMISYRASLMEVADDININLLELRRYEKNILLLYEENNLRTFYRYLDQIERTIAAKRSEILAVLSRERYDTFRTFLADYKEAAIGIVASVEFKKRMLEDIRPLGRAVEKEARHRDQALDLRRWEKNFLIYREARAIREVNRIAGEMIAREPPLAEPLRAYLKVFNDIADNQTVKDALVEKIRTTGRQIETITMEFSRREREAIETTIASSRKLFVVSFVLLLGSIAGVAFLLTTRVIGSLKKIERSFTDLVAGDFSHDVEVEAANLPDEIQSFVRAYNETMHRLGNSREELERTSARLADVNRELVERQDELVEARKVSAMRLLASEIAHEINNPLSSVGIFLGSFYEDMTADNPRRANIVLMMNEVRRCQVVLRELVDFARREPLHLKEVDPAQLVREAIDVVAAQNRKSGVSLRVDLGALPEKVVLDPVLVYQALVNILANAFQFSPPGGEVDVRGSSDEETFSVAVADRGVGIPPENLGQVFQPFFTTRKELGGCGLGLAITKKILERHGGRGQIASTPGEGTVFTIVLPREQKGNDDASPGG